ncbi:MAG: hypothetical protein ACFFD2_24150, partial [Promethearchaeota archaeon]
LCFLVFQILTMNLVNAQVVDIWGVSENSTQSYDYNKIFTGSISSTEIYPRRTYRVARIFDQDANNYTELLMQITTTSVYGLPEVETAILDDLFISWTNAGLRPNNNTYFEFNPLYPIIFNGTDLIGFNWTDACNDYNTIIDGWNMTIVGNTATINGTDSGTESASDYNVTVTIVWDISTGWLISYDEVKAYNETLGYTVHYQTLIFTGTGAAGLELGVLISIIAIAIGGIGIAFAYLAYRKSRP